ncbi:hypothetical protein [Streptomyces sp. NPDC059949]|uniref:hypothetical protein n=1 Tax=Streptomyces sp. NPDC059949 TaxID=3347013 RepID=UPI00364B064C
MTGPEHYREAELLLATAHDGNDTTFEGHNPEADREIAKAQVHATLALAAATAMSAPVADDLAGFTTEEFDAWYKTAGTRPGGGR